MRLALVSHWLSNSGGGISAVLEDLSDEIRMLVPQTAVFGLSDEQWHREKANWSGAPACGFEPVIIKSLGWAPRLGKKIQEFNPDIAHTHGIWMAPSAQIFHWAKTSRPYIVSPHGMLEKRALRLSRLKKRVARILFEDAHLNGAFCLHALNEKEAEDMRSFGLKQPIAVIPNGVRAPENGFRLQAPWKDHFNEGDRILLFLGRLHPKKNIHSLLHAMAALVATSEAANWKIVVAGWDQSGYEEKLRGICAAAGIHDKVHFLGPAFGERKVAALQNASAFILPSVSEGLPMAVLEAWSYGLPALISEECNLSIGLQRDAAVKISTNPQDLSRQLKSFFTLPDVARPGMGFNGSKLVRECFSWGVVADQYNHMYKWALGEEECPDFVVV